MKNKFKISIAILITLVLALNLIAISSAMIVNSVDANNFQPGKEQTITVKVKNTLENDVTSISLILDMTNVPFVVKNSEQDTDSIDSDDTENFDFTIKASNNAKSGDYQIPYTLSYIINNTLQTKKGTFGLTMEANPDFAYTASTETPVVESQGKITLNIVNKGLGDAKFVNIQINPVGYTLLSENNYYIGTIASDDSETASFDVVFKNVNPILNVQVEYRDFNNNKITKNINLPLTVYSQEQALQLGIIKQSYTSYYVGGVVVIIIFWLIIRRIRKKRRMNKAQGR